MTEVLNKDISKRGRSLQAAGSSAERKAALPCVKWHKENKHDCNATSGKYFCIFS